MQWEGQTVAQRIEKEKQGIRRFAFLPTQMADGTWVWLEPFWRVLGPTGKHHNFLTWVDVHVFLKLSATRPPAPFNFKKDINA